MSQFVLMHKENKYLLKDCLRSFYPVAPIRFSPSGLSGTYLWGFATCVKKYGNESKVLLVAKKNIASSKGTVTQPEMRVCIETCVFVGSDLPVRG